MAPSVLTPYYSEDTVYTIDQINQDNEDGVSILFYLQKIYPGNLIDCQCVLIRVSDPCSYIQFLLQAR